MATPAQRFTAGAPASAPSNSTINRADRNGAGWVSRRVCSNGIVCVSWQQVCIGRHYGGQRCDVHVDGDLLRFWVGDQLVKTAARNSTARYETNGPYAPAARPKTNTECQGSTETKTSTIDALKARPLTLADRGSHALKGKSADVQVFGVDIGGGNRSLTDLVLIAGAWRLVSRDGSYLAVGVGSVRARYSWAVFAITSLAVMPVWLGSALLVVAFEGSDRYVEAAAVTVPVVVVMAYLSVLPGVRPSRLVDQWAAVARGRSGEGIGGHLRLGPGGGYPVGGRGRCLDRTALGRCRCDRRGDGIAADPVRDCRRGLRRGLLR